MSREMLVNVAESEECRVAVIERGILEELYIERASLGSIVGNIYKGKVVNIEAGIQAAFIDLGTGRNGFLHISDLHPRYFPGRKNDLVETVGRRQSLKDRPPIQDCLRKGAEIVVQVTKEGLKTKGPTLSTYPALPGRYLVLMPWMKKHGVSHKIEDEDERKRLKTILDELEPPKGVGCIIRTAGENCAKRDLQSDLRYLTRMWNSIQKRMESSKAPVELFQESDLVIRALRDVFNSKITNIICDSEPMVRKIKDFLSHAYPRVKRRVTFYDNGIPLFHKFNIEKEIEKIQSRTVPLSSGGSIVIEQTEALVAIDVNSGRHHGKANAEQTALETNLEAAIEIARQLRLRDLGGLIICDFIDMRQQKNRKEVERVFRQAIKADRARSKTLAISRFGVVEMTRQRMRTSLQSSIYLACPHCAGLGFVKSHESLAIEVIRLLNLASSHPHIARIELSVSPEVAEYLQNEKRASLTQIEQSTERRIIIHAVPEYAAGKHEMVCYNTRGSVIRLEEVKAARHRTSESAGESKTTSTASTSKSSSSRSGRSRRGGQESRRKEPKPEKKTQVTSAPSSGREGEAEPAAVDAEATAPVTEKEATATESSESEAGAKSSKSKKRGRTRRRRSSASKTASEAQPTAESKDEVTEPATETTEAEATTSETESPPPKSKKRPRRRRAVTTSKKKAATKKRSPRAASETATETPASSAEDTPAEEVKAAEEKKSPSKATAKKRSRPRRRRAKPAVVSKEDNATETAVVPQEETADV